MLNSNFKHIAALNSNFPIT